MVCEFNINMQGKVIQFFCLSAVLPFFAVQFSIHSYTFSVLGPEDYFIWHFIQVNVEGFLHQSSINLIFGQKLNANFSNCVC